MFLRNLKLTNFRNIPKLNLNFGQTTLFIGKNAQGKTNLLESIYFLAATKSPRVERDAQLILQGENFCRVEGEVEEDGLTKLEITMQIKAEDPTGLLVEKRVKINGIPKRTVDYLGNLVVIYFSPEDINLVAGSPSLRRMYLDLTLSQLDREYKKALSGYIAALLARNKLLKGVREGLNKTSELNFWTNQIVDGGQVLSKKRREFFRAINRYADSTHDHPMGRFQFGYKESLISRERIEEYLHREIAAAATLIGPHRDDFVFELNGRDLSVFGSRGEMRTAVLELKLAELAFIVQTRKIQPVLLLDDVFSELDRPHQEYIISLIKSQQTILSAVETEGIPLKFRQAVQVFKVEQGSIEKSI